MPKKPSQTTGNRGGLFQQQSPGGRMVPNYAAVADNRPLPPTTKPGHVWVPIAVTPNSKR